MINGKLQPCSLDVYIAMEFGSDGDLFNLRFVSSWDPFQERAFTTPNTLHAMPDLARKPDAHTALDERSHFCSHSFRSDLRNLLCPAQGSDERR